MDNMTKQVVSMLVSSDKITLFSITGELIDIKNNEDYDTAKISEFLTPKLSGLGAVEINLLDFSIVKQIMPSDLEEHGIIITHIVDGIKVQGIFYPAKVAVQVIVNDEKITIPDVENLTGHIKRAVEEKSPSVANFLKRLAPVIQMRKHSGEDLMKFIKQSEMPLTNDGRIIAYKRVNQHADQGYFKDCHTGSVKQRVGSRVTMAVDLVDPSRHQSCSTGLHVANLGYMRGFSGSYTLIVLVNPEDFIAVPEGEDTKARVCAYEIIGVMGSFAHGIISSSHVTNDPVLKALIKNAVEGNHIKPIEEVRVGDNGNVLEVILLAEVIHKTVIPVAKSSGKSLLEDEQDVIVSSRDVMEVTRAAMVDSTAQNIPDEILRAFELLISGQTKTQVADHMVTSTRSIGRWMEKYNFDSFKAAFEASSVIQPDEAEEVSQEELETTAEMAPQIIENLSQKETLVSIDDDFAKLVQSSKAPKTSKVEQMRKLYNNWVLGGFQPTDLNALKLFKSASKKSWNVLGLTFKEVDKIETAE